MVACMCLKISGLVYAPPLWLHNVTLYLLPAFRKTMCCLPCKAGNSTLTGTVSARSSPFAYIPFVVIEFLGNA
jgi:hypothetical protein